MKQLFLLFRPAAATAVALSAAVLLASGCASTPMPVEQLAVAEAAVQRASTASTRESAPAELGVACLLYTSRPTSSRSAPGGNTVSASRVTM